MTLGHLLRNALLRAVRSLPSGVERKLKQHKKALPFIGLTLGLLTFGVNEGYRLRWEHTADAIDLAIYIHGIRGDTIHTFEEVEDLADNLEETLHVPRGRGLAAKAGIKKRSVLDSYVEALKGSVTDTEILIEKLPDEPEFKKRLENLKEQVHEKDREASAMVLTVGAVQTDDSEPSEKVGWSDLPKGGQVVTTIPPNVQVVIAPDPNQKKQDEIELQMFSLLMQLRDLNEDVIVKAKVLKEENEKSAKRAKYLVVGLILLSAGVGALGKIFEEGAIEGGPPGGA